MDMSKMTNTNACVATFNDGISKLHDDFSPEEIMDGMAVVLGTFIACDGDAEQALRRLARCLHAITTVVSFEAGDV